MTVIDEVLAELEALAHPDRFDEEMQGSLDPVLEKFRPIVAALHRTLGLMREFRTDPEPLKAFGIDVTQYLRGQSDLNAIWLDAIKKALDGKSN